MFDRRNVTAVLLAAALAAGCSEGTTEPPATAEPLSAAESMALFEAMRALQSDTAATIIGGSENSVVIACPLGGQLRRTVMYADESAADTLRLAWDLAAAPAECRFSSGGLQFTVDGAPEVRDRGAFVIVGFLEQFRLEGSVSGRLDWRLDDRAGSCDMDLTWSGEPDLSGTEPSVAGLLTGTVCGHDAEIPVESIPGSGG
ncbi:hypothetical protein [Candidatus Palauibacter sp.]|uniref:hypothetical protein n=1 Tax=Candidatus Palauibacter sp. TaxID=3101350 RepID=UPI003D0A2549